MEPTQQTTAIRANIYKLLAECFKYPESELDQVLQFLAQETEKIQNQELTEIINDLVKEYISNSSQEYLKNLQVSYTFGGAIRLYTQPPTWRVTTLPYHVKPYPRYAEMNETRL